MGKVKLPRCGIKDLVEVDDIEVVVNFPEMFISYLSEDMKEKEPKIREIRERLGNKRMQLSQVKEIVDEYKNESLYLFVWAHPNGSFFYHDYIYGFIIGSNDKKYFIGEIRPSNQIKPES